MNDSEIYGTNKIPMSIQETEAANWTSYQFAGATAAANTRGSAISSGYLLQPIVWGKTMIDAARERLGFLDAVREERMGDGAKDYVIPMRKKYFAQASWETSAAEYAAGTDITTTQIDTAEGVQFTPVRYNYMCQITNDNIRTSALGLVSYVRDEISYQLENSIDTAVSTALSAAAAMSNTVWGMQTIFGGDATDAADNLDTGDIMTTDLVAKARTLLMSDTGYYWNSNVWTASAVTKNTWTSDAAEPFLLYIAPEQEEAFLKDPQFINAAEYGSSKVVLTGEIGNYLGIRVIVTTKCPSFTAADTIVYNATTLAMDTVGHECFLVKAKRCAGIVYGGDPEIEVFKYQIQDAVNIKLSMNYHAKVIHPDAIVRIVVTDA